MVVPKSMQKSMKILAFFDGPSAESVVNSSKIWCFSLAHQSPKSSKKVMKKSSKIDAKSSQKVVLEPLGKHVAKRCGKSSQKVCPGDPKGAPNPPKIHSRTLLGPSLDPLWWSKFGLESPEEAQGGSKGRQGGPRSPKRCQNRWKMSPTYKNYVVFGMLPNEL